MVGRLAALVVSAGLLSSAVPAGAAHHSFAAEFDDKQPVTLTGTLTKMEWTNPHGWIYIDVRGQDGKVENWAIEAGAPNALLRRGLRRSDFPAGTKVIVKGFRGKNGTPTASGETVTFEDGRNFFLGASETGPSAPR